MDRAQSSDILILSSSSGVQVSEVLQGPKEKGETANEYNSAIDTHC